MPSASAVKILARDYIFEINTGTVALPVWTRIRGITSFSFDPSKSDADTSDFDSNGWGRHMVASRTVSMSIEGQRLEDETDGARDAGQAAVEDLANEIAAASIGQIRFYHKRSLKGKLLNCSANVTGPGGGNDDPAAWGAELTVDGAPETITVPPATP